MARRSPMPVSASRAGIAGAGCSRTNATHRRLTLTGHPGIGPVETWDMGEFGERRVVIFRDPDGIMLELTEHIPLETARPPFDA